MAAFDIENGTPVINARVEQIRAAITPAGQFGQISEQAYLIKKWLDRDATSLVFGASNTGKSFFALDLAIHVAAGNSWQGCRATQGHVIYVAAEGGLGFSKRIRVISQALPELFAQAQEQEKRDQAVTRMRALSAPLSIGYFIRSQTGYIHVHIQVG